jgi:hypothetical protein
MKWSTLAHALADPHWAAGGLLIARRAGESSLPIGKRIATAIVAAIPTALLATAGSLFGGYVALQQIIADLRIEDVRIRAMIQERTALREEQLKRLGDETSMIATRLIQIEERERTRDSAIAECRAFVARELQTERRR